MRDHKKPLPEAMTPAAYEQNYGGNRAFHNFLNDFNHIQDPNLRRRLALSEIDKVPFGVRHLRAIAVSGIGFFLDSYDIFAINLITTLLGVVFWSGKDVVNGAGGNYGSLPVSVSTTLKVSTSAGIVAGQVFFGWLADRFGRRRIYGSELILIILSTFCCCLVASSQAMGFTGLMTFWRVMMGIGIGADYPLSSVITAEFAPTRWRGGMMAAVFSMQGIGQLIAALVALVVTYAYKSTFDKITQVRVGAVPACFALYYRITIPETPRYTFEVAKDVEKASSDIKSYVTDSPEGEVDEMMKKLGPTLDLPQASWQDLRSYFGRWGNFKVLLGTTLAWFFLDLAFYGLGLNSHVVLQVIGYADGSTLYHTLLNSAIGTIIMAVAGSIPGYWAAILTIDSFGRKPLQIMGFLFLIIIFCILGFAYHSLNQGALLALYVLAQFFFNWGPNTTTFIVPGECFPTRYRASGHGFSAAMGKIGAIVAQLVSIPMLAKDAPPGCRGGECSPWIDRLMQVFALFMLCGFCVSFLIPETRGVTLEELGGEAPTSYNAGIDDDAPPGWLRSVFGGKPAGFVVTRRRSAQEERRAIGRGRQEQRRRGPRPSSAATSRGPSLADNTRRRSVQGNVNIHSSGVLGNHGNNNNIIGYATSSPVSDNCDLGRSASTTSSSAGIAGAGAMPAWGAGWGRVDRYEAPVALENVELKDVGSLLR